MKAIKRYRINVQGLQYVTMPEKARVLAVQVERKKPYVVAEVDLEVEKQNYLIRTYLTGEQMDPDDQTYLATYRLPGHRSLYHVYLVHEVNVEPAPRIEKAQPDTGSIPQNGK